MIQQRIFDEELNELKKKILEMGELVKNLIEKAITALKSLDENIAQEVINQDETVDQMELEIDEKCIELVALRQPEASDLRFILASNRIATDLERIGDLAQDIAERVKELKGQPLLKPLIDIPKMAELDKDSLSIVLKAFIERDSQKAREVWQNETIVDNLRNSVAEELTEIMVADSKTVSRAIPLFLVARHLERICDHITNIAEDVVYMVEGKVIKHLKK